MLVFSISLPSTAGRNHPVVFYENFQNIIRVIRHDCVISLHRGTIDGGRSMQETKLFMRVPDASTALYVSRHLGEQRQFSPIISVGGGLSIRETEEVRIKHTEILNMAPRELFLSTYSGTYKGKTATVLESKLKVKFPDLARVTMGS